MSISKDDCDKWFKSPLVNPLTKRAIQEGKPVWKKLEKDCAQYKTSPKPLAPKRDLAPKPKGSPASSPRERISPKIGKKLTKVRKGDCVGDKMVWKVGKGCFEVVSSDLAPAPLAREPSSPAPLPTVVPIAAREPEWEYVGDKKFACKPIPPLRWTPGKGGKKGKCEKPKGYVISPSKKITPIRKVIYVRPKIEVSKEELPLYESKETHFVRRVGGKIQKDCFNETVIQPDQIDIKANSFSRQEAEKHYVCYHPNNYPKEVQEWVDKHPELLGKKVLSNETYQFLSGYLAGRHMFGSSKVITEPKVKKNLQMFRLDKPIRLFRGIHFGFNKFSMIEQFCALHIEPEKSYTFSEDKPSSWTWNYTMADNFAKIGSFGFVISKVFQPSEILCDLRLCSEYCSLRGSQKDLQDEVIVVPGSYKCQVVWPYPSYQKNGLAKPENLEGLKQLLKFYDNLNTRLNPGIYGGAFGADMGGLIGEIQYSKSKIPFSQRPRFVFEFDYDKNRQSPVLYYGLNAEQISEKQKKELKDKLNVSTFDSEFSTLIEVGNKCPEYDDMYRPYCYKVKTSDKKYDTFNNLVKDFIKLVEDFLSVAD